MKGKIGYVKLIKFSSTTKKEINTAIEQLMVRGMKYLILDLRGNSGGYLDAAVSVVDCFLPGGKQILSTTNPVKGYNRNYYSTYKNHVPDIPLVVLINRFSASGAEIVAGALQDWDRALILGETSFGKGLVQSQFEFSDGSALLLSTSEYVTPAGRAIQRPYKHIAKENYYKHLTNDSLRNEWEIDPARKKFTTKKLGRKVLGGGGITPDTFLKSGVDTLPESITDILQHPKRLLFTFTEQYIHSTDKHSFDDFNRFLASYTPSPELLHTFYTYLKEHGIRVKKKTFLSQRKQITLYLKIYIAEHVWGKEESYKIRLLNDDLFRKSLVYLTTAKQLHEQAW